MWLQSAASHSKYNLLGLDEYDWRSLVEALRCWHQSPIWIRLCVSAITNAIK